MGIPLATHSNVGSHFERHEHEYSHDAMVGVGSFCRVAGCAMHRRRFPPAALVLVACRRGPCRGVGPDLRTPSECVRLSVLVFSPLNVCV